MSKKYVFPSLKVKEVQDTESSGEEEEEEEEEQTKRKKKIATKSLPKRRSPKVKKGSKVSKKKKIDSSSASESEDAEKDEELEELENQLLQEEDEDKNSSIKRKRLPELDFVLSFAHKRAREVLNTVDDDDDALTTAVATWLKEIESRFDTFEKQAAKFDEYESALLQSQRMHQKFRKMISSFLKEEREVKRSLADITSQNELRKKGLEQMKKADDMLKALET